MNPLPVVHACTHLRPLGGVQTLLRRHFQRDAALNLSTSGLIWFERGPFDAEASGRPVTGLGLRWFHSGRSLRRRLRQAIPEAGAGQAVWAYHDLWGLRTAADLDGSARRVGVIHSHWEATDALLQGIDGLVDGMLCINAGSVDLARARLPQLAGDRTVLLPLPLDPPNWEPPAESQAPSELVLGYCGRIRNQQKRVDRIPAIAAALRSAGVAHRWEFLGQGPEQAALESSLKSVRASVRFHGAKSGDEYWRILSGWNAIVFTSDYEGLPIAMLEAMNRGVLPVFPDIPGGGRDYAAGVAGELIYPAGDTTAAARVIGWIHRLETGKRADLRNRSRQRVESHARDSYGKTFHTFLRNLEVLPRISASGRAARRSHAGEWIPYAGISRLAPGNPIRRGYL